MIRTALQTIYKFFDPGHPLLNIAGHATVAYLVTGVGMLFQEPVAGASAAIWGYGMKELGEGGTKVRKGQSTVLDELRDVDHWKDVGAAILGAVLALKTPAIVGVLL